VAPLPFELVVLEVALGDVCNVLQRLTKELELAAHPALEALTRDVWDHTARVDSSRCSRPARHSVRISRALAVQSHSCTARSCVGHCSSHHVMARAQVSTANLERVRKVKTRHQRLMARVTTVREELERFLEDDDDMMKMCLTRRREVTGPPPWCPASTHGVLRAVWAQPSERP
jgi:hypothetical protein